MKKRKLKTFVLPTVYVMVVMVIFASMMFMNISLNSTANEEEAYIESDYVIDIIEEEDYYIPVVSEVDYSVAKPYTSEEVEIEVDYYSKEDENDVQEDSLIYYSNTYIQNTGILYGADESFDIIAVYSGVVKNISTDDILGTVVEITHNGDYTSFYYSVGDVTVSIGDEVAKGDIIAKSGMCSLEEIEENNLLFEVYYQGKTMDPNTFYELEITE